jgi:antitoxin (DNA-binding transcriptional repressor) of toxin-antitoxin stability system
LTIWASDDHIISIPKHSVAAAKSQLLALIDRALKGEEVVITRHGHPVVELKAMQRPARPITKETIDWLDRVRVGRRGADDAGTFVSRMGDEVDARLDLLFEERDKKQ